MRRNRLLVAIVGWVLVGCNSTLIPFESTRTKEDIAKARSDGEVRAYAISEN